MTDAAKELCLLYTLRRGEIERVAGLFADALEEDRSVNADMFDITRTDFSASKHPNATMRRLEAELQKADFPLLCMLCALSELGLEVTQGLAHFQAPADFANEAGLSYQALLERDPPVALLAQRLTEIKAEHAKKRLDTAISLMQDCIYCD